MKKNLGSEKIIEALKNLDRRLKEPLRLIVGGGGALVTAYKFPLATEDVDAMPLGLSPLELNPLIEATAKEMSLASDWLNPYFATFTHVLPSDYGQRLREFYKGKHCQAFALGPEDLLLMKCFAGRDKDIPHARALLKIPKINLEIVEDRIDELITKKIPGALRAREFFDDVSEEL